MTRNMVVQRTMLPVIAIKKMEKGKTKFTFSVTCFKNAINIFFTNYTDFVEFSEKMDVDSNDKNDFETIDENSR